MKKIFLKKKIHMERRRAHDCEGRYAVWKLSVEYLDDPKDIRSLLFADQCLKGCLDALFHLKRMYRRNVLPKETWKKAISLDGGFLGESLLYRCLEAKVVDSVVLSDWDAIRLYVDKDVDRAFWTSLCAVRAGKASILRRIVPLFPKIVETVCVGDDVFPFHDVDGHEQGYTLFGICLCGTMQGIQMERQVQMEMARILLENGTDLKQKENEIVDLCEHELDEEALSLLEEYGADIHVQRQLDTSLLVDNALMQSLIFGRIDTAKLLIKRGISVRDDLFGAWIDNLMFQDCFVKCLHFLREISVDIFATLDGRTLLEIVSSNLRFFTEEDVEELIRLGFDVNAHHPNFEPPLVSAMRTIPYDEKTKRSKDKSVLLLLRAGAFYTGSPLIAELAETNLVVKLLLQEAAGERFYKEGTKWKTVCSDKTFFFQGRASRRIKSCLQKDTQGSI